MLGGAAGWLGPDGAAALALSLKVALVATAASLPLGMICALALARGRFWGHGLLNGLVHLPLILPLTLAAAQLSRLTGQSVTLSGNLADYAPVSTLVPVGLLQEPLDALIARALTQRPEIARAQAGLADAQAALARAERDQRLPDITASVQAGQLGSAGGGGRTVGGSFGLKSGTVSGQVSFPLKEPTTRVTAPGPDGKPVTTETALPNGVALNLSGTFTLLGSGRSQATAQAQAATERAALAVQSARQGVELEVRSRFAELENAQDSLTAALREFHEETGIQARGARLVGITEGFDRITGRQQLGLCYRMESAEGLPVTSFPVQDTESLELQWIPLEEIDSRAVHPLGLSKMLDVPDGKIEHSVLEWTVTLG
mgnify:CR=1 FL=1